MTIGVPKETFPGENRVALVPADIPALKKAGLEVVVESGAGRSAGYPDASYEQKGARIAVERSDVFASADVIVQIRGFCANPVHGKADLDLFRDRQVLVGFMKPCSNVLYVKTVSERKVVTFAMELIPRISRAQGMDTLSSMMTVAGYKAALLAADTLPRMFPMFITAGGTITPARVLVIGAGVSGLQAIATAKRLGAVVRAYDIRPAVKEQVESLGARFVELELETVDAETRAGYAREMGTDFYEKQRRLLKKVVGESDAVITTAVIPGKKAPVLITEEMVQAMPYGSVIVDVAAESGGNCELTEPGKTRVIHGVTIVGATNLASAIPYHASQLYSRNITSFLCNLVRDGNLVFDMEDQIVRETMVTRDGEFMDKRIKEVLDQP
ncbi:MAG: NAD(P)(+) transhydrogenase (Re/Si-specific) subunit alpha [Deltaproteobacteria bacterium HGW-Deltaproteobacteria-15]|jgi:NAD(P) transhydrogenase subunit alpha|nr:MAG: NAD(P)(+) transhydrogenase (Re/Si-specific) subunit alpha [Deltaproteobacteria bacterium HGW-Deltaproteobacteria-15]